MPGTNPVFYWDTCLFLAWLKDEERKTGEMDGVRDVIARSKKRDVKIITSVLTTTEVLSAKIPVGMESFFKDFMKRVTQIAVDIRVAELAHELRNYYSSRGNGKTLSTPDAIHLATAILYRATEFHTFDEKGSRGSLGLIPLSGDVGGHRLTICKPEARTPQLDLRKPPN